MYVGLLEFCQIASKSLLQYALYHSTVTAYIMTDNEQHLLHFDEHLDIYHYIDPAHHVHIDKITRGVHLHGTPNPKYSRAII